MKVTENKIRFLEEIIFIKEAKILFQINKNNNNSNNSK